MQLQSCTNATITRPISKLNILEHRRKIKKKATVSDEPPRKIISQFAKDYGLWFMVFYHAKPKLFTLNF